MKIQKRFEKNLDELLNFFRYQENIVVTYLFGSLSKGELGPLSDIDFAFFLDMNLKKSERSEKKLLLINEISSIIKTDRVDAVIMNDAPLLLNFNIIKNGKILHSKSEKERVIFETSIISRYLDRKYYDNMHIEHGITRMMEKGIL